MTKRTEELAAEIVSETTGLSLDEKRRLIAEALEKYGREVACEASRLADERDQNSISCMKLP